MKDSNNKFEMGCKKEVSEIEVFIVIIRLRLSQINQLINYQVKEWEDRSYLAVLDGINW